MAQGWHRAVYAGISLPEPYYAGEFRDSDRRFPELDGYEVAIGSNFGVPSRDVPAELSQLEGRIQSACLALDDAIPVGVRASDPATLGAVLTVCGNVHGEWVRIHPFANGNGRTARLWATWIAVRYELPPFIQVKKEHARALRARPSAGPPAGTHRPPGGRAPGRTHPRNSRPRSHTGNRPSMTDDRGPSTPPGSATP